MGSNCEAYKPKNPLPFRRLKGYANGIWDETRKEFYPWKAAATTVTAKKGIRYFIHSVYASGANTGDHATSNTGLNVVINGVVCYYSVYVPATVAASNISQGAVLQINPDVLCDAQTAITILYQSVSNVTVCLYAEIPDDPAGGPVILS